MDSPSLESHKTEALCCIRSTIQISGCSAWLELDSVLFSVCLHCRILADALFHSFQSLRCQILQDTMFHSFPGRCLHRWSSPPMVYLSWPHMDRLVVHLGAVLPGCSILYGYSVQCQSTTVCWLHLHQDPNLSIGLHYIRLSLAPS